MPDRLEVATIARIEDALRDPSAVLDARYLRQLASDYDCHISTIYRHKDRILFDCPVMPRLGGPRRIITWKIKQSINEPALIGLCVQGILAISPT